MANGTITVTVEAKELPVARASVQSLYIVIGLITNGFPKSLMKKRIEECVDLKQDGLLDGEMISGLRYVEDAIGTDTYEKLVNYLAEQEPEQAKPATVDIVDKVPPKEPARKQPGKAAVDRAAAAGKKTVAQTRKKATGAADGK